MEKLEITREEAMDMFKKVYPDSPAYIVETTPHFYIIESEFNALPCYFRVDNYSLSTMYKVLDDAKRL